MASDRLNQKRNAGPWPNFFMASEAVSCHGPVIPLSTVVLTLCLPGMYGTSVSTNKHTHTAEESLRSTVAIFDVLEMYAKRMHGR